MDQFIPDKLDYANLNEKFVTDNFESSVNFFEADYEIVRPVSEREVFERKIKELEERITQAREEGYLEGYEKCRADLAEEIDVLKQQLSQRVETVIEDIQKQLEFYKETLEKECVKASILLAEKLLFYGVKYNPVYIESFLKEIIKIQRIAQITKIHFAPEDYENLKLINLSRAKKFEGIEFVADPTVKAGCIIETTTGGVALAPFERLEEIKEKIFL